MEQQTKNLINRAVEKLAQATGIKVVHQAKAPKVGTAYPDGLVRIDYKDMHYDFAIQAKAMWPWEQSIGFSGISKK